MKNNFIYKCSICGQDYTEDEITYTCPQDGGNLDILLDYDWIRQKYTPSTICTGEASIWRYLALLPVADPAGEFTPLRYAGWTPVYAPKVLAAEIGLKNLWVKDESRNPTASFKDRASAVVVARAREINAEVVVTASTGNAGAALAGMAAAVAQKAVIFAPKSAPPAKIAQLLVFGAQVLLVDGTYDQAFDLSIQAAEEFGWYCRNTGYNPFTAEGKKTAAFEIWEWMDKHVDEISHGLGRAFHLRFGRRWQHHFRYSQRFQRSAGTWAGSMQSRVLFGVQAEGSAAVANAFNSNHGSDHTRHLPTPLQTAYPLTCRARRSARSAGCCPNRRRIYHGQRR